MFSVRCAVCGVQCTLYCLLCAVCCLLFALGSVQKATYLPLVLELLVTLCAGQQLVLGGAGHLVYWLQWDWGVAIRELKVEITNNQLLVLNWRLVFCPYLFFLNPLL